MQPASDQPTTLAIFGATGDLSQKKLIPALFHLFSNGYLPDDFELIGLSKDQLSQDQFKDFARKTIQEKSHSHRPEELTEFLDKITFQSGLFDDPQTYQQLETHLSNHAIGQCRNRLFYLAVPPKLYSLMFEQLASSGLAKPCSQHSTWTRVLVEKPFGRDLKTAQKLDKQLSKNFAENQIYRIDHYLAKETVQNIITFRFANALFEPVWNGKHISHIKITQHETIGVGDRASFYEGTGALRDVGQNHLLQMLALVTMEDPGRLHPDSIRQSRAILLQQIQPVKQIESVIRAQYTGYADTDDVEDNTQTETYFKLTTSIKNKRWKNTPITLEAGKKMPENKVEIEITFNEPMSCVCPEDDQHHQNVLTIRIQPQEGISLKFWTKKPGLTYELEPQHLSFSYQTSQEDVMLPDAYEKVLYDCIRGDQTLFASTDEVEAAWRFITPILANWHTLPLNTYQPGTLPTAL